LHQCEVVKINLSAPDTESEAVIIRNFLKVEGAARNLVNSVTKAELDMESAGIVARGLANYKALI
jgi:molecular chaperone DnaK